MFFSLKPQPAIKYTPSILFLFLTTNFLLSSCSQGGGSGNNGNSQNSSANVLNENPPPNMQNYLLIGAKGKLGKGAVFKCNLDGSQCIEFIGGNISFTSSNSSLPAIKLTKGEFFGSSITANQSYIYIGAEGKGGKDQFNKPDPLFSQWGCL